MRQSATLAFGQMKNGMGTSPLVKYQTCVSFKERGLVKADIYDYLRIVALGYQITIVGVVALAVSLLLPA
jgi:hypothetical protein